MLNTLEAKNTLKNGIEAATRSAKKQTSDSANTQSVIQNNHGPQASTTDTLYIAASTEAATPPSLVGMEDRTAGALAKFITLLTFPFRIVAKAFAINREQRKKEVPPESPSLPKADQNLDQILKLFDIPRKRWTNFSGAN